MRCRRHDGRILFELPLGGPTMTKEIEILRGDLSQLLYDRTKTTTEYIFGDHIVGVEHEEHGTGTEGTKEPVWVSFAKGPPRRFDLVVAADGLRSTTRRLIFGREEEAAIAIEPLGVYVAYLTIPREAADTQWAEGAVFLGSRSLLLRPDGKGLTTRASLNFPSRGPGPGGHEGYEKLGQREQKEVRGGLSICCFFVSRRVGWRVLSLF
jgi:2-polyprenyl-6-methoxyphenol hydroxylase-like FAD-dependent oxidoreductase